MVDLSMIRQSISGEVKIGAYNMDNNEEWYGQSVEAKSDPLIDSGTGKPYIIRQFDFSFKPGLKQKPTKQQLFNQHWPQLRALIWGDGLVASTDVDPRVLVNRRTYKIILLCEPQFGQTVIDRPTTLQDVLRKNA